MLFKISFNRFFRVKKVLFRTFPAVILSTLIVTAVVYGWTEPSASPPGGNVAAPLNVGSTVQYRIGGLGIGGPFQTEVDTHLAIISGKVGIGTTIPSYKLDVQGGQINASGGLCIAGVCKTSWVEAGGYWTLSGTNLYPNDVSWKVGIGTTAPNANLHIHQNVDAWAPAIFLTNPHVGNHPNGKISLAEDGAAGKELFIYYFGSGFSTSGTNIANSGLIGTDAGATGGMVVRADAGPITFSAGDYLTAHMRIASGGNVGIGTTAPNVALEINRPAGDFPKFRISDGNIVLSDWSGSLSLGDVSTSAAIGQLKSNRGGANTNLSGGLLIQGFTEAGVNNWKPLHLVGTHGGTAPTTPAVIIAGQKHNGVNNRTSLTGSEPVLDVEDGYDGGNVLLRVQANGNIGIGTTGPLKKLHVSDYNLNIDSATPSEQFLVEGSDTGIGIYSRWHSSCSSYLNLTEIDPDNDFRNRWVIQRFATANPGFFDSDGSFRIGYSTTPGYCSASYYLTMLPTGEVGIGTTVPTQKLDVAGTVQTTGFKMPTGAASGYVLTSDASGVGTWQAAAGGGAGGWTDGGTSVYLTTTTDNVGIGTTAPKFPLHLATENNDWLMMLDSNNSTLGGYALRTYNSGAVVPSRAWGMFNMNEFSGRTGLEFWEYTDNDNDYSYCEGGETCTPRLVIKTGGNVGIGTTNPVEILDIVGDSDADLDMTSFGGDNSTFHIKRAQGSKTAPSVVLNGDSLLGLDGMGYNGSIYTRAAEISMSVDGTPASGVVPGMIWFATKPLGYTGGEWPPTRMVINANGNVGIGTTNPVEILDIVGDSDADLDMTSFGGDNSTFHIKRAQGSKTAPSVVLNGDTLVGLEGMGYNGSIYTRAAGIYISVDGIPASGVVPGMIWFATKPLGYTGGDWPPTRMVINANGDVGIGTTAPENRVHIAQAGGTGDTNPVTLRINNTTEQSSSQIIFEEDNQGDNFGIRYFSNSAGNVNQLQFRGFANTWMIIERETGNVGIGTTDPAGYKLKVAGTVRASGGFSTGDEIFIGNLDETADYIKGTLNLDLIGTAGHNLTIRDWDKVIVNNGSVGIGTTSPNEKLEISGGIRLNPTDTKPTCDSNKRGTLWFTQGASGVKDGLEICAKDAANDYRWRTLY